MPRFTVIMKTNSTPQRPAIRAIGLSLLVASLTTGAVVFAQQPPAESPAPVPPPAELPTADEPAPAGPSRTGRIPVPEEGALPAVEPAPSVDPNPATIVEYQTDPRTNTIIRSEKYANGSTRRTIVRTILDEEVSANPQDAARKYEAVISAFDSQRADAAQAIFRLGETYRKLNRLDEARVQYARILREFVDFPELARLSQQQLSQTPPTLVRGGSRMAGEGSFAGHLARTAATSAEERKLLNEEIHLLERQLSQTQELVKSGSAETAALIPIQREILQLKRQLLRYENNAGPPTPDTLTPPAAGASGTGSGTPETRRSSR